MSAPRWKPNVTVAAIVEQEGRYLLVEEDTPDGLRLNNPAGHLDPGESILEGVVRETREESLRDFEPTHVVGIYLVPPPDGSPASITWLRFAFTGTVSEPVPGRTLDAGIVRTVWMTIDEVRASRDRHRSPVLLQCVEDHHAGRRYPLDMLSTVRLPD